MSYIHYFLSMNECITLQFKNPFNLFRSLNACFNYFWLLCLSFYEINNNPEINWDKLRLGWDWDKSAVSISGVRLYLQYLLCGIANRQTNVSSFKSPFFSGHNKITRTLITRNKIVLAVFEAFVAHLNALNEMGGNN